MKITRTSIVSGQTRTRDLDITEEQYRRFANDGVFIQDAFPHLSEGEREFILTGITSEEWDQMFLEDDDDTELGDQNEPAF